MSASDSPYSRKNPFPGTLLANRKLTGESSGKDTRHFEISLEGSGFAYEPGDSLGVFPRNDAELVDEILRVLGFSGTEPVSVPDGGDAPIREALSANYVITEPSKQLLQACAEKDSSAEFLRDLLDPNTKTEMDRYVWGRGVIDPLLEFDDARFTPEEFVKTLRKLQPRLYSIASSRAAVGDQVHLTVAVVRYESNGRRRKGVCSCFLAESDPGARVPVFVHSAKHFRLPEDPALPVIMVGPGTGIAPFRAFLQERRAAGTGGPTWLFFGEQREASDFLYRAEFEQYLKDGSLSRLDTAFSRDQSHKIYVQDRMRENGAEIYKWIQDGAYFYVCGDAARMARDVDSALHEIAASHGGKSPEEAAEFVKELKHQKRYRRDVY